MKIFKPKFELGNLVEWKESRRYVIPEVMEVSTPGGRFSRRERDILPHMHYDVQSLCPDQNIYSNVRESDLRHSEYNRQDVAKFLDQFHKTEDAQKSLIDYASSKGFRAVGIGYRTGEFIIEPVGYNFVHLPISFIPVENEVRVFVRDAGIRHGDLNLTGAKMVVGLLESVNSWFQENCKQISSGSGDLGVFKGSKK